VSQLPTNLPDAQSKQRWKALLDPVLANPLLQGRLIENVALSNGTTLINHMLGRALVGWIVTRINAQAQVYDNQNTNNAKTITLSLTSNAAATVSLWVF